MTKLLNKLLLLCLLNFASISSCVGADSVIHISVDGLFGGILKSLDPEQIPNFSRLLLEGSSTLSARTDTSHTNTLPNHTSQFTGLPVSLANGGHGWTTNSDKQTSTIHDFAIDDPSRYISSIFDVVHDAGLSTSLFSSKSKFLIFDRSWNEVHGAADISGEDNGRDKIDQYTFIQDTSELVSAFISDLQTVKRNYAFLHLRNPDSTGHADGWDWTIPSSYSGAVIEVDRMLGLIISAIESDINYVDTILILTSDHGGENGTTTHTTNVTYESQTVPFIVWGAGVQPGTSLYELNICTTKDPRRTRTPSYQALKQPIRNSDAANLAARVLELDLIPGSSIQNIVNLSDSMENENCRPTPSKQTAAPIKAESGNSVVIWF